MFAHHDDRIASHPARAGCMNVAHKGNGCVIVGTVFERVSHCHDKDRVTLPKSSLAIDKG